MAKRKRRSNNPKGGPSRGIDETRVLVPMPQQLAADAAEAAEAEGVSRAEFIRRAMLVRVADTHERIRDGYLRPEERRPRED